MSVSINGTNGLTFSDGSSQNTGATGFGFKNRIINGAMMIDQRNAGASVTPTDQQYTLDRYFCGMTQAGKFTVQRNAGSVTPPVGFVNYLGCTSTSSYSIAAGDAFLIGQRIEGLNVADFGWGTADAQPVTVSFRVRSSLTGTFGGVIKNSAENYNYPFSYVINSANTWEYKTITLSGATSGTWLTSTGTGLLLMFSLGVGSTYSASSGAWVSGAVYGVTGQTNIVATNGATFYITGVQLEKGSTATSFDYRPYGTELALCQRYYQTTFAPGTAPAKGITANDWWTVCSSGPFGNNLYGSERFKVAMRASPSLYFYNSISSGAADNTVYGYWASSNGTLGVSMDSIATHGFGGAFTGTGIITHGFVRSHYTASAEL